MLICAYGGRMNTNYYEYIRAHGQVITVVIVQEFPGYWFAQALQYDFNSAASKPTRALRHLKRKIARHVERALSKKRQPFQNRASGPEDYRLLFVEAIRLRRESNNAERRRGSRTARMASPDAAGQRRVHASH